MHGPRGDGAGGAHGQIGQGPRGQRSTGVKRCSGREICGDAAIREIILGPQGAAEVRDIPSGVLGEQTHDKRRKRPSQGPDRVHGVATEGGETDQRAVAEFKAGRG